MGRIRTWRAVHPLAAEPARGRSPGNGAATRSGLNLTDEVRATASPSTASTKGALAGYTDIPFTLEGQIVRYADRLKRTSTTTSMTPSARASSASVDLPAKAISVLGHRGPIRIGSGRRGHGLSVPRQERDQALWSRCSKRWRRFTRSSCSRVVYFNQTTPSKRSPKRKT